jgi:hypothetical protein
MTSGTWVLLGSISLGHGWADLRLVVSAEAMFAIAQFARKAGGFREFSLPGLEALGSHKMPAFGYVG